MLSNMAFRSFQQPPCNPRPTPLACHKPLPPLTTALSPLQPRRLPTRQTARELMETTAVKYVVWDATVSEGDYTSTFK